MIKLLEMLYHKLALETYFFLTPSLIGTINDRLFLLTNQQVVFMVLTIIVGETQTQGSAHSQKQSPSFITFLLVAKNVRCYNQS